MLLFAQSAQAFFDSLTTENSCPYPQASQALVIYGLMFSSGKIRFCI